MSTVGEFHGRLRAKSVREKVVHDSGVFAQRVRLVDAVARQLGVDLVRVHTDDGLGPGLQRRPGVLVRGRDLRTQTQGYHVVRDKHGLPDRHDVQLRVGFYRPLENRGPVELFVPDRLSRAGRVCEYRFLRCYTHL